jgi:hypothetical protein
VIPRQRIVGAKKRVRRNAAKPLQKHDLKRYVLWRVRGMEDALRPAEGAARAARTIEQACSRARCSEPGGYTSTVSS